MHCGCKVLLWWFTKVPTYLVPCCPLGGRAFMVHDSLLRNTSTVAGRRWFLQSFTGIYNIFKPTRNTNIHTGNIWVPVLVPVDNINPIIINPTVKQTCLTMLDKASGIPVLSGSGGLGWSIVNIGDINGTEGICEQDFFCITVKALTYNPVKP